MSIKIGPAGVGPVKDIIKNLEEYHKLGIKNAEIPFTYGVYIKDPEIASQINKKASELGIELSIHAQYWVNLNSIEPEKREATKRRILECCRVGELLGVKTVVFHPGFYTSKGKGKSKIIDYETTFQNIKKGVLDIIDEIKKNKWKITISPETMGKVNVFGSPEEISRLVKETGCSFCIDFAHILARDKKIDYEKIKSLFPQKEWHCHFSGIVYNELGERHHRMTLGQEWENLIKNLPKDKNIRIVCESPDPLADALNGLRKSN
jgi:deoxyribonuclease-4